MTSAQLLYGRTERTFRDCFVSPRWVLFTLLVTLNVLDVYLTMLGIELGIMREANPVIAPLIGQFWLAAGVKLTTMGFVAVLLRAMRPRWTFMEWVLSLAVGWYLAVVLWNLSIVWPYTLG